MSPHGRDPLAEGSARTTPTASRMAASTAALASANAASRRNEESWVEIASQPSSSSVSSITDEIVTTGLRVGYGVNGAAMPVIPQRRRRLLQQVEAATMSRHHSSAPPPPIVGASSQRRSSVIPLPRARSSAGSSQEEYDETESEEDRLMSSSAEQVHVQHPTPPRRASQQQQQQVQLQQVQAQIQQKATASDGDDEEDEDDDDEGTALGKPSSNPPTFRPQPNAFSHPPTHLQPHRSVPSPPHQHLSPGYGRSSAMSQRLQARTARTAESNFLRPSYREDNDADLRASLTTLLSCAAAARGLGKKESETTYGEPSSMSQGLRSSSQPMELRLVPESELMADPPALPPPAPRLAPQQTRPHPHAARTASRSSTTAAAAAAPAPSPRTGHASSRGSTVSAVSSSSRSKRAAAAAAAGGGKSARVTKKKRTSDGEATAALLSPTLLSWVVSAGVVVLVSVVGFSAGFVIGREVGRQDAAASLSGGSTASNATSCGSEIMRSSTGSTLRRFRWGAGMTRSAMA